MFSPNLMKSGLMAGLLVTFLVSLIQLLPAPTKPESIEPITVSEISLSQPPPTPPTREVVRTETSQQLKFDLGEPEIPMQTMIKPVFNTQLKHPPLNLFAKTNWQLEFKPNISTFSLAELDEKPRLLTPIRVEFPSELKKRGVNKALVKLHVMIDNKGRVILKSIMSLKFPELIPALRSAIKQAKFSSPKKNGETVNAEFVWPLVLSHQ